MERQRGLFRHHVCRGWSCLQRRCFVLLFPRNALLLTATRHLIAFFTANLFLLLSGHLGLVRPIPTRLPQVNSMYCISFPKIQASYEL